MFSKLVFLTLLAYVQLINGSRLGKFLESSDKLSADPAHNWAVLVAGSATFSNYRHQADVAHAYQVLKSHNFHEDKIITMMYDDVAYDQDNPFPGKLFNNYSHIDVYQGVKVDYRKEDVKPKNLIKLMEGDKDLKAKGFKVLESTAQDNVFFYFADHGSEGFIAFPHYGEVLYANDFKAVIDKMVEKKMFKQFVIYIEACESGSMFQYELPENVYATTAANSDESSYGCYCLDKEVFSCLGDLYSVNWIHDTETHALSKRTLQQQYLTVKQKTTKSHVQQFGDKNIAAEMLDKFMGTDSAHSIDEQTSGPQDFVDSRKAHLVPHLLKLQHSTDSEVRKRSRQFIDKDALYENHVEALFDKIETYSKDLAGENSQETTPIGMNEAVFQCYKNLATTFFENCFSVQKYPMVAKHMKKLKNICVVSQSINRMNFEKDVHEYITEMCRL